MNNHDITFLKARPLWDCFLSRDLLLVHRMLFYFPQRTVIPPMSYPWWDPPSLLPWWHNRQIAGGGQ